MPITVNTTRTSNSLRLAAIGQSLGAFYYYNLCGYYVIKTLKDLVGSLTNGVEIAPYAIGGSYASKTNMIAGDGSSAQWNDVTPADEPDTMLVNINVRKAERLAGNTIDHFIFSQGEADSEICGGYDGITPQQASLNYYNAWYKAITETDGYRANTTNGVTSNTKFFIQMIGRSYSNTKNFGYERIRQQQFNLIANIPGVIKGPEAWDLALNDSVHPANTIESQGVLGLRMADVIMYNLYGMTDTVNIDGDVIPITFGPSISSVTKVSDQIVQVVIAGNGESVSYPDLDTIPCGFAFSDAGNNFNTVFDDTSFDAMFIRPVGYERSGNTLTFTLPTPITGSVKCFFPFDHVNDFNTNAVIRGATSDKPLQSYRSSW